MRIIGFFALLVTIIGLTEARNEVPSGGSVLSSSKVPGIPAGCADNKVLGPDGKLIYNAVHDAAKFASDVGTNLRCGGIGLVVQGAFQDVIRTANNILANAGGGEGIIGNVAHTVQDILGGGKKGGAGEKGGLFGGALG
ncbi:hypothetical protein JTE90_023096 [Oedothorax gibbosus]|uniref:Uncharacterized protein n=1 Tax=Oedothorax gibbosus TaxID=931172 RepID=A0AAV6TY91_9ARAC|nr:hypothetical protein JTE90_023096 [Oedothorax gibbosus]